MKNKGLLVCILLLFVNLSSKGYEVSCRDECYDSIPLVKEQMDFVLEDCPACTIHVEFIVRSGTCEGNPVRDIYLESIAGLNGTCTSCPSFNYLPRLLELTLGYILKRYRWADLEVGMETFVKVKYPPCLLGVAGKRLKKFCLNNNCCIHEYKLLIGPSGNNITGHRQITEYDGECPIYERNSCTNICSVYVDLDPPIPIVTAKEETPIHERTEQMIITIPADNKNEIRVPFLSEPFVVYIYNVLGELVYQNCFENEIRNIMLDATKLTKGLYCLTLRTSRGVHFQKIFIVN